MKISEFVSENFQFLVVKFSIYLNRRVFVMNTSTLMEDLVSSLSPQRNEEKRQRNQKRRGKRDTVEDEEKSE